MQHPMINIQLRRCQKQIEPTSLNDFEDGINNNEYRKKEEWTKMGVCERERRHT